MRLHPSILKQGKWSPWCPPSTIIPTTTSCDYTHLLNIIEGCNAHVTTDGGCAWDLVYAAGGVAPLSGLEGAGRGKRVPERAAHTHTHQTTHTEVSSEVGSGVCVQETGRELSMIE